MNKSDIFLEKKIFFKDNGELNPVSIMITKILMKDDKQYTKVIFDRFSKFDADIHGSDQFNIIENAMVYIEAICRSSKNPEFFINKKESLYNPNKNFKVINGKLV